MNTAIAALAVLAAAGAAQAQSGRPGPVQGATTIQCLEPSGRMVPATCRVPASRVDPREAICQCLNTGLRTVVPVCPAGVEPPPESRALETARREGVKAGSLVGATFDGKPICAAPRMPLR
jgi:hypothetical protein